MAAHGQVGNSKGKQEATSYSKHFSLMAFKSPHVLLLFLRPLLLQSLLMPVAMSVARELHPVILVPGQSGSQLEARLMEDYEPSLPAACGAQKGKDWFTIWKNASILQDPDGLRAFAEQLTLVYDSDADDYRNAPGVETRVPFFGSVSGIRYLDPDHRENSVYMDNLVRSLEGIGYKEGTNLFGAPYDFRYSLAAEGHPSKVGSKYFSDLKELVEKACNDNGGKPVIILTHSFGGLLTLQFLNRNPPWWRQRFVKHFVALAAPWGGVVRVMSIFTSGDSMGLPYVDPLLLRDQFRRTESNLWLLPSSKAFGERPLVITKDRQYTGADMAEFLRDIGFEEAVRPYKSRVLPLFNMAPPGVPVTCMVGVGLDTPESLLYHGDGKFDELPEVVNGDGDGLVNLGSSLALEAEWSDAAEQELKIIKLAGGSHASIVTDDVYLRQIIREVSAINLSLKSCEDQFSAADAL